jgi:hypothetical protein
MDTEYPEIVVGQAYRNLFGDMAGEIVLKDLEHICHANKVTFTPDPYVTAFNEGQRSIILYIKDRMNANIEADDRTVDTLEGESYGG